MSLGLPICSRALTVLFLLGPLPASAQLAPVGHFCRGREVVFQFDDTLAASATTRLPEPDPDPPHYPLETVERMFRALAERRVADYLALLAPDHRFESNDPGFARAFPAGADREVQRQTLMRVFGEGVANRGRPHVISVWLSRGHTGHESRRKGMQAHDERVIARQVRAEFVMSDGGVCASGPAVFEFELAPVRTNHAPPAGAAAARAIGGPRPKMRWLVRRTIERTIDGGAALLGAAAGPAAPDSSAAVVTPDSVAAPLRLALRALAPGARDEAPLELTLTSREPARLEWFDVQGRRCASQAIADPTPGVRRLAGPQDKLASGVYWARVWQGRADATTRVVVLR